MGLEFIDQHSQIYCSSSSTNDRILTNSLLNSSQIPFKCSTQFSHSPIWADGIDLWSSSSSSSTTTTTTTTLMKKDSIRYQLEFHCDLGLYLPRHEKPVSAPLTSKYLSNNSTKLFANDFKPERIRLLLKKEKELLEQNSSPRVPMNSIRSRMSIDVDDENQLKSVDRIVENVEIDSNRLKNFLKEHLTEMLTRGSTHLQRDEQQNEFSTKKISSKCVEEKSSFGIRVTPIDLISTKQFQSISLEKMAQQRNSLVDQHENNSSSSSSSSRSSCSSTPSNSSPNLSRPSTQPQTQNLLSSNVHLISTTNPSNLIRRYPIGSVTRTIQEQFNGTTTNSSKINSNFRSKPKSMLTNESNSNEFFVLADSSPKSIVEQNSKKNLFYSSTIHRNAHRSHHQHQHPQHQQFRSACPPVVPPSIDLLPPIISGKRLHIPAAHHRYL